MKLGDIALMEIRDKKDYTEEFNLTSDQRASVDMLKVYVEEHGCLPSKEVKDVFLEEQ